MVRSPTAASSTTACACAARLVACMAILLAAAGLVASMLWPLMHLWLPQHQGYMPAWANTLAGHPPGLLAHGPRMQPNTSDVVRPSLPAAGPGPPPGPTPGLGGGSAGGIMQVQEGQQGQGQPAAHMQQQGKQQELRGQQQQLLPAPQHHHQGQQQPQAAHAAAAPAPRPACSRRRLLWLTSLNLIRDHDWARRRGEAASPLAHLQAALASARAAAPSLVPVVVAWTGTGNAASQQPWLEEDAIAAVSELGAVVVRRNSSALASARQSRVQEVNQDTPPVPAALLLPYMDLPAVVAEAMRQLPEAARSGVDPELVLWTDSYVLFTGDVDACALERPQAWSCGGCSETSGGPEGSGLEAAASGIGVALINVVAFSSLCEQGLRRHAGSGAGGGGTGASGAVIHELRRQAGSGAGSGGNGSSTYASASAAVMSELLPRAGLLPQSLHYRPHWGMPPSDTAPPSQVPHMTQPANVAANRSDNGVLTPPGITLLRTIQPPLHHLLCALNQADPHQHDAAWQRPRNEVAAATATAPPAAAGAATSASLELALEHCCIERGCSSSASSSSGSSSGGATRAALGEAWGRDGGRLVRVAAALFEVHSMAAQRSLKRLRPVPPTPPGGVAPADMQELLKPYQSEDFIAARAKVRGMRVMVITHFKSSSGGTLVATDLAQLLLEAGAHVDMATLIDGRMQEQPSTRLAPLYVLRPSMRQEYELAWFNPRAYDAVVINTVLMDDASFGFWLRHQVEAYGEAITSRLIWWMHEYAGWAGDSSSSRLMATGRVPILGDSHKVLNGFVEAAKRHAREALRAPPQPPTHFILMYPILLNDLVRSALAEPLERAAQRSRVRREVLGGVPDNATLVLFVGRFDADGVKGHLQTLDAADVACARLVAAGVAATSEACLHIAFVSQVGHELPNNLNARLKALPPDHVHVVHPQSTDLVQSMYYSADMLVMNSRDEPFGRVAIEAMASGLPVIVCAAVATVVHNVTGLVHQKQNDVAAIAQHILDLHPATPGGAQRAARIGVAGRASFISKYHPALQQSSWFKLVHAAGERARSHDAAAATAAAEAAARVGGPLPAYLRQVPQSTGAPAGGYSVLSRYSVPLMPVWARRDLAWDWRRHADAPAAVAAAGVAGVRLGGALYVFGGMHANATGRGRDMWRLPLDVAAATNSSSSGNAWAPAAPLPPGMGATAMSAIPHQERLMYLAGGVSMDGTACVDTAAVYDAGADAWVGLPPLPVALCGVVSVVDPATHVLHLLKGTPSWMGRSAAPPSQDDDNRYSHLTLQLQPDSMPAPGSTWQVAAPAPADAMARHTVALLLHHHQQGNSTASPATPATTASEADAPAASAVAVQLLGGCYVGVPGTTDAPPGAFAPPWRLNVCTLDARPSYRVGLKGGAGAASLTADGPQWAAQPAPLPLPLQHMCGAPLRDGVALLAGGANAVSWANSYVYAYHARAHAAAAVGYLPQGPLLAPVCAVWRGRLWVLLGESSARGRTALGAPSAEVWSAQLPEGLMAGGG